LQRSGGRLISALPAEQTKKPPEGGFLCVTRNAHRGVGGP
jgi:hypothetical protein